MLVGLYGHVLRIASPTDPDRDRFVLSKGHAALALYAALHLKGWLSKDELDRFCSDGSRVAVHPEAGLPGVEFSTGSLGMGLSFGVGAALAARLQRSPRRVFVLLSDAECNEGSVWEAVAFAAHHRLSNLVAIVDLNGQQAFGYTQDVVRMHNMRERWSSFGWNACDVDGHDVTGMVRQFESFHDDGEAPHVLVAHTIFGKGVSFMERQIKWHYWPMNDEEYARALSEIGERP